MKEILLKLIEICDVSITAHEASLANLRRDQRTHTRANLASGLAAGESHAIIGVNKGITELNRKIGDWNVMRERLIDDLNELNQPRESGLDL